MSHQKRLDIIDDIIHNKSGKLQREIEKWVETQLDDEMKYYEYSNYKDIHDLYILKIDTKIESYNITNVSEDYISVQLKVYLEYKVEIIIDDDAKEWISLETKTALIEDAKFINVDVAFGIEGDDTMVYEPEIETINYDRELEL